MATTNLELADEISCKMLDQKKSQAINIYEIEIESIFMMVYRMCLSFVAVIIVGMIIVECVNRRKMN